MQAHRPHLTASLLALALWAPGAAWSQVAAGETHQGVKVVSVGRDEAVIETQGARSTVRLGEAPVSVGARTGSGSKVVLRSDGRGHFVNQGLINGKVMQFMVDTGATTVAIGRPDADRMGLDYKNGQSVQMSTANGTAQGWRMRLDSAMPYVLLGNSFLGEFQMTRTNDQMVLEKRR